jgi:hypothetical protein
MSEPGAVPIEDLREEHFQPKWYLNGFPKSGLHWVALMVRPIASPQFEDHEIWSQPWAGTFRMNSWTNWTVPTERVTYKIGRLQDGKYIKGHAAYSDELERFLFYLGTGTAFIYRDMRDVAVSQAFHVLNEDDTKQSHPDKDLYKSMASFDDVLRAVIEGIDKYPGVMERWSDYAGWLDVDWVCKLSYEEIQADPQAAAVKILRHGLARTSGIFGLDPEVVEDNLQMMGRVMVQSGAQTHLSPTFRRGETRDWQTHFSPELARLFAETDRDGWLVRLGYAMEGWEDDF